jgi:homoserine kinase type II
MSVFTPVSEAEAHALLDHYSLGDVERLEGIAQGVENTNYFLTTTTGDYVLTLFEHLTAVELPFYVNLMAHLANAGVRCPVPMARDDGELLSHLNGKPAIIVSKLAGAPRAAPDAATCRHAGRLLGQVHNAGVSYDAGLENWRGRAWREDFARQVAPKLSAADNALIASENAFQAAVDGTLLPQGVIHGDYFHDNVLWDPEDGEPGVIDFYFACDDALLYDVAIAVNDWCVNADASLDARRMHAFVEGYRHERALEDAELALWPAMLRRAALRTWLGRLGYNHFPRDSQMTIPKDHAFSRRMLERHRAEARPLEGA